MKDIKLPSFDLTGKTAVITGATRGLGWGIARTYAEHGASVVLTARTESAVTQAADWLNEQGFRALGVRADSSVQADIDRVVALAAERFGRIDILVNNAGVSGRTAPLTEQTKEDFENVLSINLTGCFLFGRAVARHMTERGGGGKIINMASVGGLIGGKGLAPYGASKAGVISLTKTMANELAKYNITVNAICPGYVMTELNEDVFSDPDIRKKLEKRIALRRLGTVEEIAGPALALASDCFGYMTGAYLLIDGGQTIGG